jgi:hypothetical protein
LLRACPKAPTGGLNARLDDASGTGRYMKEYREIRAKVSFLELCKNTDLAAEVSLQPKFSASMPSFSFQTF